MVAVLSWIFVPGGMCSFGDRARPVPVRDLFWGQTSLTREQAQHPALHGLQDTPLTDITYEEALTFAQALGGRLPKSTEWEWMAAGALVRLYPWGNEAWTPLRGNLAPSRLGHAVSVGSFPLGATPEGVLDVAGNVWEWTSSLIVGNGAVIRGGSYNSLPLYAKTRFLNAAPCELRSLGIGIRVVREP